MEKETLLKYLSELGVPSEYYSLEGDLNPDSIVLYESYNKWIVFYLDERGNREKMKEFNSQAEANDYVYYLFRNSTEFRDKGPKI
jgi:hypothetical protein